MPVPTTPQKDLIDLNSSPRKSARRSKTGSPQKTSTAGTPLKKTSPARKSPGKTQSKSNAGSKRATPSKRARTDDGAMIEDVADLPQSISEALASLGYTSLSDLKALNPKELQAKVEAALFAKAPVNEIAERMQKELLAAWLRFLVAGPTPAAKSWRDFIDTRRLDSQMTAKGMLEAESILKTLRPRQLIQQRSALRRVTKPMSKQIQWSDLKQAKGRLTKIPKGEALAMQVNEEILADAKRVLKQVNKK